MPNPVTTQPPVDPALAQPPVNPVMQQPPNSQWSAAPQNVQPADYQGVQQYADAAYDESRRYLDPQQAQENRRMDQSMINKGLDPNSAMGQEMMDALSMRQGDQNNAAAFQSMQFGQGIQDQYAQQGLGWGALDYQQNMGEHGQMMDVMGYNQQDQMLQDALYNQQYASVPIPGISATNPYSPANTMMGAGDTTWWQAGAKGSYGFA